MVKVVLITFAVTLVLTAFVMRYYLSAASRPGNIVIPAGNTYLGPHVPWEIK